MSNTPNAFHKSTHTTEAAVSAALAAAFGVAVYERKDGNPDNEWALSIAVPKEHYVDDTGWIAYVMDENDLLVAVDKLADVRTTLPADTGANHTTSADAEPTISEILEKLVAVIKARVDKRADKAKEAVVVMTADGERVPAGGCVDVMLGATDWGSLTEDAHAMLHGYASADTHTAVAHFLASLAMAAIADNKVDAMDVVHNLACFTEQDPDTGALTMRAGN